jgi:hypothetical protein
MNETTYIYIVHSDIDENNIYAEFLEEQAAIEYARKNASELTYVDKVEVLLDEDGDILDEFDSETIWVYSDEEAPVESEEDPWDMLAVEYEEQEANKHDLGDTTWFESLDTDELVETLEENETEVECKECFDLFPKTDCVKVAFGYICPTCAKCEVADEDIFKIDFPEYEKFPGENEMIPGEPDPEPMPDNSPNPEPMPETEETENDLISEPEEAVPFLVKDEEEAIAGYDEATEVIQDSDIENKEEILNTLDHIKEEEKEHIEELQDLEVDTNTKDENDPISNPEEIETPEDDIAELEELFDVGLNVGIDGGENNNVSVLSSHEPEKEGEEELKELFDANVNLSLDGGTGNDVSVLSPLGGVGLGETLAEGAMQTVTKEEFKAELEASPDAIVICSTTDCDYGIRCETYEAYFNATDNNYEVYSWAETYRDDFTDADLVETFSTFDELWDYIIDFKNYPSYDFDRNFVDSVNEDYIIDTTETFSYDELYKAIVTEGDIVTLMIDSQTDNDGNTIDQSWEICDADGVFSVVEHFYNVEKDEVEDGDFVFESDDFDTFYAALARKNPEVFIGKETITEHVNEEHSAVESEQELEGTDNAVVDCKVADVVTHSEDEKPVDCEGKKKPLEKPLTEDTHAKYAKPEGDRKAAYNNALKYAKKDNAPYIYGYSGTNGKFFALDQPVKVTGDIVEKEKEFRNRYKNCKVVYVAYPDKAFMEGYQKFTPEEMEEYGIDEDGNSIEGYDEYVRCTWCEDIFTKDMCGFEADFGWLCDRCQMAISSRGERLSMIINPTEDDFKRVMTEQVSMTSAELIDKYGTDDIDLINAGKEPEERVELKEEAPEYDLTEVNELLKEIRGTDKKKSIHMR